MRRELKGRPGRSIGPLKEKTVHAALTKQRIHALVGQVIDELEKRRAAGKSDFVKTLADEVEKGGIAAWKALRDLLPRDDDIPSGSPSLSFSQLFIAAHKEINRSEQTKTVPPVIDVTAEPGLALAGHRDHRRQCNRKRQKTPTTWSGDAKQSLFKLKNFGTSKTVMIRPGVCGPRAGDANALSFCEK
jgi:hypothetical protein